MHQALRELPVELIDSVTRRVLACLTFQTVRMGFQTSEEPVLRKVMLSELPLNTRKWRKYATFVMQYPELSEDQKALQTVQKEKLAKGEEVPEGELIKETAPFDERHVMIDEFEVEGSALEEFLLSLGDFSDVVRAKVDRWKNLLSQFQKQLTNVEEVDHTQKKLAEVVEFWDGVKTHNPLAHLQTIVANTEAGPRQLEFACKTVRRAMEMPEFTLDQIVEALLKVKVGEEAE